MSGSYSNVGSAVRSERRIPEATNDRRTVHGPDVRVLLGVVLNFVNFGVILVGQETKVLYMNVRARSIVANGYPLRIKSGKLIIGNDQAAKYFEYINSLVRTSDGVGSSIHQGFFRVSRTQKNKECSYRLLITRLGMRRASDPTVIHIYDSHLGRQVSDAMLKTLFGLTPAEARVVIELFSGQSLTQIAEKMKISINTARVHLKKVFTKCDVSSQAELIQLMACGPGVS